MSKKMRKNPVELLTIARPNPFGGSIVNLKNGNKSSNVSSKAKLEALIKDHKKKQEEEDADMRRNPKRKSRKTTARKASSRKTTARKASSRKTTARKASSRKTTAKKVGKISRRRNASTATSVKALGNVSSRTSRTSSKKSRKRGLPKSVLKAIRSYGPHRVYIVRGGEQIKIEAQKSSAGYKKAKKEGLYGRFKSLYSKKNDQNVLHIVSVRDAFNSGRPATEKEVQEALNVWAGAYDGHHLNRRMMKMVTDLRSRSNPAPIRSLGRMNPAPLGFIGGGGFIPLTTAVSTGEKVAITTVSGVGSLVATNALSGLARKLFDVNQSTSNGKKIGIDLGAHVVSAILPAYYLYKGPKTGYDLAGRNADPKRHAQMHYASIGWLAGVAGSALARLVIPETVGKIPLVGGLMRATNVNEKNDNLFAKQGATGGLGKVLVSNSGGRKKVFLNGMGRFVPTVDRSKLRARPSLSLPRQHQRGNIVDSPRAGYVNDDGMGKYILDRSMNGYVTDYSLHGTRSNPRPMRKVKESNPMLHQPEVITGTARNFSPSNNDDMMKQIHGIDCLSASELAQEGIDATQLEGTYFCRAMPDYARDIVQANLGLVVSDSNVVDGAIIVQLFVDPQQVVNRTQIGGQPDMGKGAHHARNAGIFTGGIFNSVIPAVDNGYSWSGE